MRRMWIIVLLCASACQSTEGEPVPAVLTGNDADALAEIVEKIATLLHTEVTLSPTAFSQSSLVTLEHAVGSDPRGKAATGMVVERPEQFRLLWSADGCSLMRLRSGETLTLPHTSCRPETKKKPASSGLFE
jgi:hypothetical protein